MNGKTATEIFEEWYEDWDGFLLADEDPVEQANDRDNIF